MNGGETILARIKAAAGLRMKHKDWVAGLPPTRALATGRAILELDSVKPGEQTRFFVSLEAMRWFYETIGYAPPLQKWHDYQEYFFDFDRPEDAMLFEIRFPRH